jgi:hypothetical protein
MVIFDSGLFWFIEGVLACLAVLAFRSWTQDRGCVMPWWKWLLVAGWTLFVGAGVAFVGTSLGENEPRAAAMAALFAAVIGLISAAALWRILRWK